MTDALKLAAEALTAAIDLHGDLGEILFAAAGMPMVDRLNAATGQARAALAAIEAAQRPEWVLVPAQPTQEMADAFDNAHHRADFRIESYRAMLAARPAPEHPAAPIAERLERLADSLDARGMPTVAREVQDVVNDWRRQGDGTRPDPLAELVAAAQSRKT